MFLSPARHTRAHQKKSTPYGGLAGTPPRNEKKILRLSWFVWFSYVSALFKARYPRMFVQFQIVSKFFKFLQFFD